MAQEIERKFLLDSVPVDKIREARQMSIIRGYLLLDERRELRIRKIDNRYYMTRKSGFGLVREEYEVEIDETLFKFLWPLTEGRRLEKVRYAFNYRHYLCELDNYSGSLAGLVILEIEFPTVEEAGNFSPPSFVKREITDDPRYKNSRLAELGKPAESWII